MRSSCRINPLPPVLFAFVLSVPGAAQDAGKKGPPDDIVGEAIRKGCEWLKSHPGKINALDDRHCTLELVLLTLVHGGVRENDPFFAEQFKVMRDDKPKFTYRTALRAMVLEEVQRVRYQPLLYHCAQFLVDNQSPEGDWGYGEPTELGEMPAPKETATVTKPRGVVVFDDLSAPREKPIVVNKVSVRKKRDGKSHDNSNSQYAALGLRACHDSGIIIPPEVIDRAIKWWRQSQEGDPKADKSVATGGGSASPRGWNYTKSGTDPYGSMSVGAVGALAIYLYMQGKNWKQDRDLAEGVAWIGANFSVTDNPKKGEKWHYYYLYGLERAGVLYDTPRFGRHDWYAEGAWYLLKQQAQDGSWGKNAVDTCFAILFLKRATRPLVASQDPLRRK
jgi:hypothetical protein